MGSKKNKKNGSASWRTSLRFEPSSITTGQDRKGRFFVYEHCKVFYLDYYRGNFSLLYLLLDSCFFYYRLVVVYRSRIHRNFYYVFRYKSGTRFDGFDYCFTISPDQFSCGSFL